MRGVYQMNNKINDYKRAAYHEAGHAVIAEYFGLPWNEICIGHSDDNINNGYIEGPAENIECKRENILIAATFYMAGRTAETEFYHDKKEEVSDEIMDALASSSQDVKDFNKFYCQLEKESEEPLLGDCDDWQIKGSKEAVKILYQKDNKHKFEVLVEILLKKKKVGYENYKEILNQGLQ